MRNRREWMGTNNGSRTVDMQAVSIGRWSRNAAMKCKTPLQLLRSQHERLVLIFKKIETSDDFQWFELLKWRQITCKLLSLLITKIFKEFSTATVWTELHNVSEWKKLFSLSKDSCIILVVLGFQSQSIPIATNLTGYNNITCNVFKKYIYQKILSFWSSKILVFDKYILFTTKKTFERLFNYESRLRNMTGTSTFYCTWKSQI